MWLSGRGDGLESNRPATNFPGISVDSNRFDCLADKSGLGVEFRRLERAIKQNGFDISIGESLDPDPEQHWRVV